MMGITIYIVDDEPRAVQYFRKLLAETGIDYSVVGTASNGVKAVQEVLRLQPDIVFADMSMPVMDGLQMSQEILKKNPHQKIIVLTAYKSFEFVQQSIKAGITDYVLKNQLSSGMLRELLERMAGILDSDGEKLSLIHQYNYKQFLLSKGGSEAYPNIGKKRERIVVISFVLPKQIRLKYQEDPVRRQELPCYELEKLKYPDGVVCRCIAEMNANEFAGIFCLEQLMAEETSIMRRTAECMEKKLEEMKIPPFTYVISESTYTPLDIPDRYREARKLQDYLYRCGMAYSRGGIYRQSGMKELMAGAVPIDSMRAGFLEMVEEANFSAARKELSEIFELVKQGRDIWEYSEEMRNIVRNLNDYVARNHIDIEEDSIVYDHEHTQSLEEMIRDYLSEISEAVEVANRKQYSRYTKQAIEYMQEYYTRDIAVPDIAEAVGISEGHLRKVFKQETDRKIIDFLTDYRLEKAKRYMLKGEHVLDTIWKKTGFASAQYFSYVFKKKEGISPRDYIKRNL